MFARFVPDAQWAAARVASLPAQWGRRLLKRWGELHGKSRFDGNTFLRKTTDALAVVRIPLDASDSTICDAAHALALRCADRAALYHDAATLRASMARIAEGQGIEPPPCKVGDGPAIARMTCSMWWRRKLRRNHGRSVEGAAIVMGLVNQRREIYVSNETLQRCQQQNERNAATLEATTARNELGQEYTLAELAATGPANKAIRRAELMTRIAGFERIARDMAHAGLFMTITCPSRMHRWRTVGPKHARIVVENARYDGTTPRQAQKYLAKLWARIRAKLKRKGVGVYGFRIAEPNHDGTPHWHFLIFHKPEDIQTVRAAVLEHALKDCGDEPGARRHRVDFKAIDWSKGTAAGYIAKYVAKNIDGYKVGEDLYGNPAMEASARVEAWARTWGIRQFQQVGGPPVGPWRELRRIEALPMGAPDHLVKAHQAVNKVAVIEGRENASVAWDHYCQAQGGVFCGRDYRIRVSTVVDEGKKGRYGDPAGPRPVGVETVSIEMWTPPWMAHMNPPGQSSRVVSWIVESTRHEWVIVGRTARHGEVSTAAAKPAPWTRVNNCTEGVSSGYECNGSESHGMPRGVHERVDFGPGPGGALHGAHVAAHGRGHPGAERAGAGG